MAIKNYAENWIDTYNSYLGAINFSTTDMAELVAAIRRYVTRQTPEGVIPIINNKRTIFIKLYKIIVICFKKKYMCKWFSKIGICINNTKCCR